MTETDTLKKELNEARLNLIIAITDTIVRIVILGAAAFSLVCLGLAALSLSGVM